MSPGEKAGFGEDVPLVSVAGGAGGDTGAPKIATTTVAVEGMTCGACTATIEGLFMF
jgi:Cu+-exporting ATPase